MAIQIDFNSNVGDFQRHMKLLEKEAKKSGKMVTKELDDLNKELTKTIKKQTNFEKREKQLKQALQRQLDNERLTEKEKQRLIDKYNKAAERRYKQHYERLEDLTKKAYKAQERIREKSIKKQNGMVGICAVGQKHRAGFSRKGNRLIFDRVGARHDNFKIIRGVTLKIQGVAATVSRKGCA